MFNKAICHAGSGNIKYIIVSVAQGYLDLFNPGTAEFAIALKEADYFMAMRDPGKFMVNLNKEGYEMVMVAQPVEEAPETVAETPKKKGEKSK